MKTIDNLPEEEKNKITEEITREINSMSKEDEEELWREIMNEYPHIRDLDNIHTVEDILKLKDITIKEVLQISNINGISLDNLESETEIYIQFLIEKEKSKKEYAKSLKMKDKKRLK